MRQIILDTETTGLNPRTGDRVIEIGCVEMLNRQLTGNNLHFYINPERDSDEGALAVHGLTTEFLSDKPKFAEIADEFRDYVRGAEIIIHNAPFDVGFLDAEFKLLALRHSRNTSTTSSTRCRWPRSSIRAAATRWTPCATATASPTRTVPCTAACSMRPCWRKSIWP